MDRQERGRKTEISATVTFSGVKSVGWQVPLVRRNLNQTKCTNTHRNRGIRSLYTTISMKMDMTAKTVSERRNESKNLMT